MEKLDCWFYFTNWKDQFCSELNHYHKIDCSHHLRTVYYFYSPDCGSMLHDGRIRNLFNPLSLRIKTWMSDWTHFVSPECNRKNWTLSHLFWRSVKHAGFSCQIPTPLKAPFLSSIPIHKTDSAFRKLHSWVNANCWPNETVVLNVPSRKEIKESY